MTDTVRTPLTKPGIARKAAQRHPKRRRGILPPSRPMFYGFLLDWDHCVAKGIARFGPIETEDDEYSRFSEGGMTFNYGVFRIWKSSRMRLVKLPGTMVNGISLVEKKSEADPAILPLPEVIDRIKEVLETDEEPQWYPFCA